MEILQVRKCKLIIMLLFITCGIMAEGSIKAYSPPRLKNFFECKLFINLVRTIKHSYANFGKIPYGTVLV